MDLQEDRNYVRNSTAVCTAVELCLAAHTVPTRRMVEVTVCFWEVGSRPYMDRRGTYSEGDLEDDLLFLVRGDRCEEGVWHYTGPGPFNCEVTTRMRTSEDSPIWLGVVMMVIYGRYFEHQ